MATLADLVFDCRHPASLAKFWSSTLDGYEIAPYDESELARLSSLGITDVDDDPTVLIENSEAGPRIWFQRVPEPKITKNRVHIDVRAGNPHDEVERLMTLGAAVVAERHDGKLTVMTDPEGNEFCVIA